ncbi:hypothetical protein WA158_002764, partial [Blastocystis sp. Blastoise]
MTIEHLEKQVKQLTSERNQLQDDLKVYNDIKSELDILRTEHEENKKMKITLEKYRERLEEMNDAKQQIESLKKQNDELYDIKINFDKLQKRYDELNNKYEESETENIQIKVTQTENNVKIEQMKDVIDENKRVIDRLTNQIEVYKKRDLEVSEKEKNQQAIQEYLVKENVHKSLADDVNIG